ncbi:MAG TPA: hypothetical protein VGH29_00875, partial [Candidatus Binataceae bacterium]
MAQYPPMFRNVSHSIQMFRRDWQAYCRRAAKASGRLTIPTIASMTSVTQCLAQPRAGIVGCFERLRIGLRHHKEP